MWVLPAVLAALIVSMPAQLLVADRIAEPYPGLFQPAFFGTSQTSHGAVEFPFAKLFVDGRRVRPVDVLRRSDRREVLKQMFPPRGKDAHVDAATVRSMRRNLTHRLGTEPRELVVRWQERRFHLDTGKITRHKKLATYRVDLSEAAP